MILTLYAGAFSFIYLLYRCVYLAAVGASVFAWVFPVARDVAEKTLTSINENQNQNRELNSPALYVPSGRLAVGSTIL